MSLVKEVSPAKLSHEIQALPQTQQLFELGNHAVYWASASQIPHLLAEIGRLRVLNARSSGTGMDKAAGLDSFDDYYHHLFVWDIKERKVAGSIRIGLVDKIKSSRGKESLFLNTQFKIHEELYDHADQALELGCPFIRSEYSRSLSGLMLLWRGIGSYLCRFPHYRYLLGTTNIDGQYETVTRRLLVQYLSGPAFQHCWRSWFNPKHPFDYHSGRSVKRSIVNSLFDSVDEISHLISEMEADHRGVPEQLQHYLRLGGKVLGFNVNKQSDQGILTLLMVDLLNIAPQQMQHYLGNDNTRKFLESQATHPQAG